MNGSKRKIEYDGGNTVKGRRAKREREREREGGEGGEGRERERESEGSVWIKRKVCGGRDVSVAEAACLPRPLLALRPALRAGGERSPGATG